MYESYWQLERRPFENWCDPEFYFPAETHQAALLKLRYAVENRRGAALLAGPSGSGKTMLAEMLRDLLAAEFSPIVHLVFPQMSADELLAYLGVRLGGTPLGAETPGVHESVRRIEGLLEENVGQGKHAVVVIDEAHLVQDNRTWEALRLLLNFQWSGQPGLTLVLAGQPGVLPTLDRLPHLEERLAVKCLLRPLSATETRDYVTHRLKTAGTPRDIFEPDALDALDRLAHGVPRRINRLCDLALLIGYAEELRSLTAEHLDSVSHELVAVVPE